MLVLGGVLYVNRCYLELTHFEKCSKYKTVDGRQIIMFGVFVMFQWYVGVLLSCDV